MDSEKLARFITNLGQFNGYGSSIAQTKAAIDTNSLVPLRADNDDRVIFEDTLKAINRVQALEFSVKSIIEINAQFTGDSPEQPTYPGKLRNVVSFSALDDIHVNLWQGNDGEIIQYFPPKQIDEYMLQQEVNAWLLSDQSPLAAWMLFAKLAKMQPFEDGNKRTALIAANHAIGALETQNYLTPPTGRQYSRFMDALLGYYGVGLEGGADSEQQGMAEFLDQTMPNVRQEDINKLWLLDRIARQLVDNQIPKAKAMITWDIQRLSYFLTLDEAEQDKIINDMSKGQNAFERRLAQAQQDNHSDGPDDQLQQNKTR